jgi:hypothetical protein
MRAMRARSPTAAPRPIPGGPQIAIARGLGATSSNNSPMLRTSSRGIVISPRGLPSTLLFPGAPGSPGSSGPPGLQTVSRSRPRIVSSRRTGRSPRAAASLAAPAGTNRSHRSAHRACSDRPPVADVTRTMPDPLARSTTPPSESTTKRSATRSTTPLGARFRPRELPRNARTRSPRVCRFFGYDEGRCCDFSPLANLTGRRS